jgi:hypothetical protein
VLLDAVFFLDSFGGITWKMIKAFGGGGKLRMNLRKYLKS